MATQNSSAWQFDRNVKQLGHPDGGRAANVPRRFCSAKMQRTNTDEDQSLQPQDLVAGPDHGRRGVSWFSMYLYNMA